MHFSLGRAQSTHNSVWLHGNTTTVASFLLQTLHLANSFSFSFSFRRLALSSPEKQNVRTWHASFGSFRPSKPQKAFQSTEGRWNINVLPAEGQSTKSLMRPRGCKAGLRLCFSHATKFWTRPTLVQAFFNLAVQSLTLTFP